MFELGISVFERHNGVEYTPEMKPFVEQMLHKRVVVKINVDKYVSWDHRKLGLPAMTNPSRLNRASTPVWTRRTTGAILALVHHLGYGFHADACAPGILRRLDPVRARNGLVVELGCGSGLLTRHLVDAGHRVIATDASPAMLDLARETVPDAEAVELLTLPDDPIPPCDAIVSVGHVLSYLPTAAAHRSGPGRRGRRAAPGRSSGDRSV